MKILWFTNTPSCYSSEPNGYNGGGWISSLEKEIRKIPGIELGICFQHDSHNHKTINNNVTYYPISYYKYSLYDKLLKRIPFIKKEDLTLDYYIENYLKVINDFKPDLITVFGSENNFCLISKHTNIPVLIHIQGILTPYYTAYFPPRFSFLDLILENPNPIIARRKILYIQNWKKLAKREQNMIKNIPYFMGRTEWDKRLTSIYAPKAKYFHCDEILRNSFYENNYTRKNNNNKLIISSTISSPFYKGFDTILQTAVILKDELNLDFEWNVYGITNIKYYEKKFNINSASYNIKINGIVNEDTLVDKLLETTVYVHPSYIDNSPNSLCEAQLLGCPIIATNIGGIPSLIENNETGLLVPANDPYQMAYLIKEVYINKDTANKLSEQGKLSASKRHDRSTIVNNLLDIYKCILNEK